MPAPKVVADWLVLAAVSHGSGRRVRPLIQPIVDDWSEDPPLKTIMVAMKPRVAITVGDPAGIGPEIARKAADDPRVREVCEPVIYGPPAGARFTPGVLSAEAGRAAYDAICAAVRDAQAGHGRRPSPRRR